MDQAFIHSELEKRILVLDGATGTLLQRLPLTEADFRGTILTDHPVPLKGNNDLLCLTRPDIIASIHRQYLEAGADIISTSSFNANAISQADYGTASLVYDINVAAASIAKREAIAYSTPDRPRFACASIGPTGKTASISPSADDPSARAVSFDELAEAYRTQVRGLLDGGIDILMVETIFDALNAKAALYAISQEFDARGTAVPVMISASVSGLGERLLTGQTIEAFCAAVSHAPNLLSIGLNCGLGAAQLAPVLRRLHAVAPCRISTHPNAGLPDGFGHYSQTPEQMSAELLPLLQAGLISIVGGCCGTTPEHIHALVTAIAQHRIPPAQKPTPHQTPAHFSGIEKLDIPSEPHPLVLVGERSNVAGSRRFLRLMKDRQYAEAVDIARAQVVAGAHIIDVNMDDPMLDSASAMRTFLNFSATEPILSNAPVMVDSSDWNTVLAGLKCLQGRGIVNSISLKDGPEKFVAKAQDVHRLGAAVLVMCFDEKGQADTCERRREIAERSYRLLTENGIPPESIIIDANVFAIATGIPEHDGLAADFIDTVHWIKMHLPRALTSGGISNVSFAFRGNDTVRTWIHSIFLHHAVAAGLDMGIVNPAAMVDYASIPEAERLIVEDAVLNRTPQAAEHLAELAMRTSAEKGPAPAAPTGGGVETLPPGKQLEQAVITGDTANLKETILLALDALRQAGRQDPEAALSILEGPLMAGLAQVGERFGAGILFLPQVLKSAQVMKQASAILEPFINASASPSASCACCSGHSPQATKRLHMLMATVKGDVHDIGKNIVATVMRCNGWDVTDLGVMVEGERIIDYVKNHPVDLIGLSGLITPSLAEMEHVAESLEREGLKIPLVVGGAAVSDIHTAVKIAPHYSGVVACGGDASSMPGLCASLVRENVARATAAKLFEKQEQLRREFGKSREPQLTLEEARERAPKKNWAEAVISLPRDPSVHVFRDIPLRELVPLITWGNFLRTFGFRTAEAQQSAEARQLLADARNFLNSLPLKGTETLHVHGVSGIFPAYAENELIHVTFDEQTVPLQMVRALEKSGDGYCVADYVAPQEAKRNDWIGMQAVCAGNGLEGIHEALRASHDDYHSLMADMLATRLAEAGAEWLHRKTVEDYWGGEGLGIRPAPGYPSCPDHALKRVIFRALDAERAIDAHLTESAMMVPEASTCAFIIRT